MKTPPGLPHAQPPFDPARDPLVGNETVDDNVAECAQIAIWNVIGNAGRAVTLSVDNGVVTISGRLVTSELRDTVVKAIARVRGVQIVIDETVVPAPVKSSLRSRASRPRKATHVEWLESKPFIYVIRFCNLDEASMSAAIRQAIAELDALLAAQQLPAAQSLIVVYRNRLPQTVTLEIGVPVDIETLRLATGDISVGKTPGGSTLTAHADPGLAGLLQGQERLATLAAKSGHVALDHSWQDFEPVSFRPWLGHPAARLHLPVRQKPGRIAKIKA